MRVERVARLRFVEAELDASIGADTDDFRHASARFSARNGVLLGDPLDVTARSPPRRVRVELVRLPLDLHVVRVLELAERAFEVAFADVAPRAHDVGPDLDVHLAMLSHPRASFPHEVSEVTSRTCRRHSTSKG